MLEEKKEKPAVASRRRAKSDKAEAQQPKKLYRSKSDRMIAGVCGGAAKYLNLDPQIVRIVWALSVFAGGVGLVAYIAAWIVVPENPHEEEPPAKKEKKSDSTMIWGLVLIAIGGFLLLQRSDWFGFYPFWDWGPWWSDRFDAGVVLPIILIVVGIVYLISVSKKETEAKAPQVEKSGGSTMEKKLTRSVSDKMIAGVCGGIARYFNIDSSIVRILWVVATVVATPVLGVLIYIVMIIVVPEETAVQSTTSSKSAATKSKAK